AGLFLLLSCHPKKYVLQKSEKDRKPKQLSLKKIQSNVEEGYLDYKYLQLKFTAKVHFQEAKYSLKGQIRQCRDSIIWMNISHSTNVPVARVILTPDSVIFINRIYDEYYEGDYSFLDRLFKIELNYSQIQSLINDELFTYPDWDDIEDMKKGGYKDRIDSNMYCLKSIKDRKIKRLIKKEQDDDLIIQDIYIEPDSFKVNQIFIHEYNLDRKLNIFYSDFMLFENKVFPEKIDFILENDSDLFNLSIKYTKITTEKEISFPSNIPENFEKIK
ncbi:MAG: DUF4292 domain-containing protein, partial [Bacteroidota bacterium]